MTASGTIDRAELAALDGVIALLEEQSRRLAATAPPLQAPGPEVSPILHLEPQGLLASQMLQYMAALKVAASVPGCRISNVSLPEWGITLAPIETEGASISVADEGAATVRTLIRRMQAGEFARIVFTGHARCMENFSDPSAYRDVFSVPRYRGIGFGPEYLVCHVRAGDYPIPVAFYQEIVAASGLRPVLMGQTAPGPYMERLRAALPQAQILPQSGVIRDFETIRQSANVVVSCSTFCWLAAWLSEAQRIVMPVWGFLSPRQAPGTDLLPLRDPRYSFYLFPITAPDTAPRDDAINGLWREMPPLALRRLMDEAPRFPYRMTSYLEAFDEAFYVAGNADARAALAEGALRSGLDHYRDRGFGEGRPPLAFDAAWYAAQYPMAAFEVAQGDYRDLLHHYVEIGRRRGYRPVRLRPVRA
jgi:hypothetical protein